MEADDRSQHLRLVDEQLLLVCAVTVQTRGPSTEFCRGPEGTGQHKTDLSRPEQTASAL